MSKYDEYILKLKRDKFSADDLMKIQDKLEDFRMNKQAI